MPRIRPYTPDDWDSFLSLDQETGLTTLRHASPDARESFKSRWPEHLRSYFGSAEAVSSATKSALFVLEDDASAFAGHLWLKEDEDPHTGVARLRVHSVAVAAKYRSRGWGRLLMARAVEEARSRGLSTVVLEVDADNVVARKLYEEMGFATVSLQMVKALP